MTNAVELLVAELETFVPSPVAEDTVYRLYQLLQGFSDLPGRELAVPAMFSLFERHPTAEFGNPGPLVHEIEAIPGSEVALRESLARCPTPSTVWMVNRILNQEELASHDRQWWLGELRRVVANDAAPQEAREGAAQFLEWQTRAL